MPSMRRARLAACSPAAAAAVLVLAAVGAAAQPCILVLPLNATASAVSFNGSAVTKPAIAATPLTPAHPEAAVGFEGALALVLPGSGPCPATAADALAQLADATLQTSEAAGGPLTLYPVDGIELRGSVVNLTLQANRFELSGVPLAAAPGGATNAFAADMEARIVEGTVLSQSLIATETLTMVGVGATNASTVAASVQGSTLRLEVAVSWVLSSTYNSTFGTTVIEGNSDYRLSGTLLAQVTLGCPGNCSAPNGVCAAASDGTPGCACRCGWSGANCEVPSGFCPEFPSMEQQGQAVCPAAPVAPPPSGEPQPCVPLEECTARQTYNAATGACDCKPGWGGPTCAACQSDAACDAAFGGDGATCSDEVAYQQGMQFKAFTCDLAGTGLESTIVPTSFSIVCNTSAVPAGAPAITSSADQACSVRFALTNTADNPVTCAATECAFRANSSSVACATTTCECQRQPCAVQGILDDIRGKPCSIDCTPEGLCTFDIQGFFVTLTAPCKTAACVVPGYLFVEGDYTITTSQSYDSIIAALPVMVLAGLAAFLSLYLIRHRALFASGRRGAAGAASAAALAGGAAASGAAARRRPADPVQLLTFDAVSCAVPVRHGRSWRPWRRGGKGGQQPAADAPGAVADVRAERPARKHILHGVSGAAACGELVGVLGPSGSGKTTLLAILSKSTEELDRRSVIGGSVLLDGQRLDWSTRRKIAYVAQDDTLLATLTVEECVRYSAILRMPGASAAAVQGAVASVLMELGLSHVARSRVGGTSGIRGISGGERRRLTVAMELVIEPAVLVLDEPTSGLDSYTALNLMRTMKQVASGGRIVLLSFHQPSPAMFSLLDRTFLMAAGHCIFSGGPAAAEPWFAARGLPCPVGTAIAEHMLDCVSDPATLQRLLPGRGKAAGNDGAAMDGGFSSNGGADGTGTGAVGAPAADGSSAKLDGHGSEEDGAVAAAAAGAVGEHSTHSSAHSAPRRASLSRELAVVFWRTLVDIVRNPTLLLLHWVLALLMGAFVGAVFFDVSFDVSGAQNRVGAMFFVLCFFAFTSLTTVDLFMLERKMVLREVRGGYYRPGTYLLSKMVLDALLLRVIPVFVFAAPFYPMMGLQGGSATIATFLMVVATFAGAMGALSLGVTVGSATAGTASLIMNILLLVAVVVSGMLVNPESMPGWIRWTHFVSPFFYAYSSLMINEMTGIKIDFELKGYAAASNVRGTVFLETIGIEASDLTRDIIINDVFYLGLALIAFLRLYLIMPSPPWLRRAAAALRPRRAAGGANGGAPGAA